jgi:sn1-specific diacylglycerol lipase
MPGLVFLNRRWNIASDDLFYPGLIELISRSLWLSPQLFFYIKYKEYYNCPETDLLHTYYISFLCTMTLIIFVQFWIVNISSRGTIADSKPRRLMVKFLYLRTFLVILELAWSIVGTIWLANVKIKECSLVVYYTVLANLIFCGIAVFFMFIVIFIVFDPLSHLDENDIQKKRNILNYLLNKMCCCFYCCLHTGNSRQANYENSYKQISALLEMIFRNGDLTPSDIAAGKYERKKLDSYFGSFSMEMFYFKRNHLDK